MAPVMTSMGSSRVCRAAGFRCKEEDDLPTEAMLVALFSRAPNRTQRWGPVVHEMQRWH